MGTSGASKLSWTQRHRASDGSLEFEEGLLHIALGRIFVGLPCWFSGKESACQCRRLPVRSLVWEDPLEKERATCSSILAWEIPWTEEPGRIQSIELQKSD
ncbi:unnamed protein product [Rangifer tarandus platyrhynchus]|uniref:Uncharacterized protein n=1 Tax=Rangifer tarandus platyrhynchus TaxID=3082113 RepID=A0AC59Z4X2_RANTA